MRIHIHWFLNQFLGNTVLWVGIEARGNFTDQDDLDSFSKVNEADAKIVEMGQKCLESDGAFLKYMGTVSSRPYIPSSFIHPLSFSGSCCMRHGFFRFPRRPRKANQLLGIQVGLSSQNLSTEMNVLSYPLAMELWLECTLSTVGSHWCHWSGPTVNQCSLTCVQLVLPTPSLL